MKIAIINGPNLNLLGRREPAHYGTATLEDILRRLQERFPQVQFVHLQSNSEGTIIDAVQTFGYTEGMDGIVLNAGAYTHTSLAIADAIAAIPVPVIEVHLSNIFAREQVRHHSFIAPVCAGSVSGFGADSYSLAVQALLYKKEQ